MITTAELHRRARAQGLSFEQAEKDYMILLLLSALSSRLTGKEQWYFKGGTCLRHCYYAGYRFSEDIDFTCVSGDGTLDLAVRILADAAAEITTERGVKVEPLAPRFDPVNGQTELAVQYLRAGARKDAWPQVKIHLSLSEPVLDTPVRLPVESAYGEPEPFPILAYSMLEIVSEKLRALLQQQARYPRARDLFDLWYITCVRRETLDRGRLRTMFERKCRAKEVEPDLAGLTAKRLRDRCGAVWRSQIGPAVRDLPDYDAVWAAWVARSQELL